MSSETRVNDGPEQLLRRACAELERRLRGREEGGAERLLAEFPDLAAEPDHAIELIYTEYCIREDLGQAVRPEDWYRRFPDLGDRLRRLLQVHEQLGRVEASVQLWNPPDTDAGDGAARTASPTPERSRLPALGDYELLDEIGRGGMGVVYKARQLSLNRPVALKMILVGAHATPGELARFRLEAETLARLQHPNIVQIYDIGEHGGHPYFVMEYVEGGNLDELLLGRPMPTREAAELVETLARAIHAAHERGVVHCDLKPANVLLSGHARRAARDAAARSAPTLARGESLTPKITDFGLARRLEEQSGLTKTGAILGTPSYMAPEQAAGKLKEISRATDVYALGAVLYELLTGRPPFQSASPVDTLDQVRTQEPISVRRLQAKAPRDLETICLKCLRKEPHKRYGSAQALARDLKRFLQGEPIVARPIGVLERSWRWCARQPAIAALLLALGLTLVGGFAAVTSLWLVAKKSFADAKHERDEAKRLRGVAESNYRQARDAVDEFARNVAGSRLFNQPGMQPLRRELLEAALKYYKKFLDSRRGEASLQGDVARTYHQVARLAMNVGTKTDALAAAREACRLQEELVHQHSADAGQLATLASMYKLTGYIQAEMCRPDEALATLRLADQLIRRLVSRSPEESNLQEMLAQNLHDMGLTLREAGDRVEAMRCFEESAGIRKALVARHPDREGFAGGVAWMGFNIGRLRREAGEIEAAERDLEECRQGFAGIGEKHPDALFFREGLADSELELGFLKEGRSARDAAVAHFRESRNIYQGLVKADPSVVRYQHGVGVAHAALGRLHRLEGNTSAARAELGQAQEIQARLAAAHGDEPGLRSTLGETLAEQARLLLAQGLFEAALTAAEDAVKQQQLAFDLAPRMAFHPKRLAEASALREEVRRAQIHVRRESAPGAP